MRTINIIALLAFFITLNACTKDIDLPIPETTPRLVMNGVMEADSLFILNLSSSVSAKSGSVPSYVNDGLVQVFENGVLLKTLALNNSIYSSQWGTAVEGNYLDSSFKPMPGHSYEIKASKTGFNTISATVTAPLVVNCDTLSVNNIVITSGGGFGGSQSNPGKSIQIKVIDQDLATKNYYLLRIRQFDSSLNGMLIAGIGTNNLDLQELNGLQGANESADVLYFSDELFKNGEWKGEVHFEIWGRGGWGSFSAGAYFLEVLKVSKDYYLYLQSVDSYNSSSGNPFAEPSQVSSNVLNGYGMIGAQSMKRFQIPK